MYEESLKVYLRGHAIGARGGASLADRLVDRYQHTEHGVALRDFASQVREDDDELRSILDVMGVTMPAVRRLLALVAERAGRAAMPVVRETTATAIRLLDVELMMGGVRGKLAMWVTLHEVADPRLAAYDFERLAERAGSQLAMLDRFHRTTLSDETE